MQCEICGSETDASYSHRFDGRVDLDVVCESCASGQQQSDDNGFDEETSVVQLIDDYGRTVRRNRVESNLSREQLVENVSSDSLDEETLKQIEAEKIDPDRQKSAIVQLESYFNISLRENDQSSSQDWEGSRSQTLEHPDR